MFKAKPAEEHRDNQLPTSSRELEGTTGKYGILILHKVGVSNATALHAEQI
jgi:hypothetical protein